MNGYKFEFEHICVFLCNINIIMYGWLVESELLLDPNMGITDFFGDFG